MSKIGWGQLGIVLALSRVFSEAANFPHDDITYGMQRFTVIVLSFVLLAAVLVPIMLLLKRRPNENLFSACRRYSPATAGVLAVIFTVSVFAMMITVTVRLEFYTSSTIFDASPAWLIILFVLIVCLYALLKGLPAVVRTGVFAAGGFLLLLVLVVCGTFENITLKYIYPAIIDSPESLFGDVMREFSKNFEAVTFAALCSEVREKAGKSLVVYFCLTLPALLLMTFLYNTILGEYLDVTGFPFYMLASLSDVSIFQRLDGIDVIVWLTAAVIRLSLLSLAVENACAGAFGNARAAKGVAASVLTLSALVSLFFSRSTTDFAFFSELTGTGFALLVPAFVIPLACLIIIVVGRKKEKREGRLQTE